MHEGQPSTKLKNFGTSFKQKFQTKVNEFNQNINEGAAR
jgi:hypothetical protein